MTNRYWRSIGLAALLAPVLASGCTSDDSDGQESVPEVQIPGSGSAPAPGTGGSSDDGTVEEVGRWRGNWDGKKLTITPLETSAEQSSITPQGFIGIPKSSLTVGKLEVWTEDAIVINSTPEPKCVQDAQLTPNDYFLTPASARTLINGATCRDHHLCALVTLENHLQRDIFSTFIQLTSITSGFKADNSSTIPEGYPLSAAMGLWRYEDLPGDGDGSNQVQWDIELPNCNNFSFDFVVMAAVHRTDYAAPNGTASGVEFVDACTFDGHQEVLQNAGPDVSADPIGLPFPFTLFDFTFDKDNPYFTISSNGALGGSPIVGTPVARADGRALPTDGADYTLLPFWTQLKLGPKGVCYGVDGTAPNRRFVATWTNADIVGTANVENLTFSAVLKEGSDDIDFLYNRWSNNQTNCVSTSSPNRGVGAAIGVQRTSEESAAQFNKLTEAKLPNLPLPAACGGQRYKISFAATPKNGVGF